MRQIEPAATRFFNNAGRSRNSEAGLAVHDLSAPRTMPGAERRRFLRFCPCLAAVRVTAAVLVVAAASLVLDRPAFAADETFWSATLNLKQVATGSLGCQNGTVGNNSVRCSVSSVLSDDDFIVNGVTYGVQILRYDFTDATLLYFSVNPAPPDNAFDGLRLHAGSTAFNFADATALPNFAGITYYWFTTLSWSLGDDIPVRITGSVVTATLEPFRTPVESGDSLSFRFDLKLSERVWVPFADMRDRAFDVTNGTILKAMRVDLKSRYHKGRWRSFSDHWRMTVEATDTDADVSVSLLPKACGERGAVCSRNGAPLGAGATLDLTPPMHPSVSIADATGKESDGYIAFDITLSNPTDFYVEVYFKTTDEGTATLGTDYRKVDGWFVFVPGETTKQMHVSLIDDEVDDDGETVFVQITEAQQVDPYSDLEYERLLDIDNDKATGTINNADALPRALLARFGRTAAVHVVEHVEERMQAPREPGFRGRFAGRELQRGMERDIALDFFREFGGMAGTGPAGGAFHDPLSGPPVAGLPASLATPGLAGGGGRLAAGIGPLGGTAGPLGSGSLAQGGLGGGGLLQSAFGGGDVLTGSAFALNRETRDGGILSFWSRGAQSSFDGREGALALDGAVRTTMFGADYAKGAMVMGLSLAHSRGLGGYDGVSAGAARPRR